MKEHVQGTTTWNAFFCIIFKVFLLSYFKVLQSRCTIDIICSTWSLLIEYSTFTSSCQSLRSLIRTALWSFLSPPKTSCQRQTSSGTSTCRWQLRQFGWSYLWREGTAVVDKNNTYSCGISCIFSVYLVDCSWIRIGLGKSVHHFCWFSLFESSSSHLFCYFIETLSSTWWF